MRCLITAFEAFGGAQSNASELALQQVPARIRATPRGNIITQRLVLPVCGAPAWNRLRCVVRSLPARERFALLLTGLAEDRKFISLERFALNVRDYSMPDNCALKLPESQIARHGPNALRARADLAALQEKLHRAGIRAVTSYHAGTFICNETYYRALRRWSKDRRCTGILFMHVPSPQNYANLCGHADPQESIVEFAKAMKLAAAQLCSPVH